MNYMSGFVLCEKKKNRPQVSVQVCRNCRYRQKCRAYNDYLQPMLFSQKKWRVSDHVLQKRKDDQILFKQQFPLERSNPDESLDES